VKRKTRYVPERGDVVWISMDPQAGHEQAGRRPALVLSLAAYNRKTSLALFCPITGQVKGYPFEVSLPEGSPVRGVALADQVKSLDWRARIVSRFSRVPPQMLIEVLTRLVALMSVGP
jgi:mRNA interferase MazF